MTENQSALAIIYIKINDSTDRKIRDWVSVLKNLRESNRSGVSIMQAGMMYGDYDVVLVVASDAIHKIEDFVVQELRGETHGPFVLDTFTAVGSKII